VDASRARARSEELSTSLVIIIEIMHVDFGDEPITIILATILVIVI
jgi:hypothetical protein